MSYNSFAEMAKAKNWTREQQHEFLVEAYWDVYKGAYGNEQKEKQSTGFDSQAKTPRRNSVGSFMNRYCTYYSQPPVEYRDIWIDAW